MFAWLRGDGRLPKRVSALEDELATLRREHREAVLEAGQLYEQTRRILGRLSKRTSTELHVAPEPPPGLDDAPRSDPDPVSARILAIRRMGRARPGGA